MCGFACGLPPGSPTSPRSYGMRYLTLGYCMSSHLSCSTTKIRDTEAEVFDVPIEKGSGFILSQAFDLYKPYPLSSAPEPAQSRLSHEFFRHSVAGFPPALYRSRLPKLYHYLRRTVNPGERHNPYSDDLQARWTLTCLMLGLQLPPSQKPHPRQPRREELVMKAKRDSR